ncbi:hypothetical protein FB451DRAFT_1163631 [Mycena latifolia]|nr:hypothetical protein FB451DRAFT_1163631 [Mycena latifolia]
MYVHSNSGNRPAIPEPNQNLKYFWALDNKFSLRRPFEHMCLVNLSCARDPAHLVGGWLGYIPSVEWTTGHFLSRQATSYLASPPGHQCKWAKVPPHPPGRLIPLLTTLKLSNDLGLKINPEVLEWWPWTRELDTGLPSISPVVMSANLAPMFHSLKNLFGFVSKPPEPGNAGPPPPLPPRPGPPPIPGNRPGVSLSFSNHNVSSSGDRTLPANGLATSHVTVSSMPGEHSTAMKLLHLFGVNSIQVLPAGYNPMYNSPDWAQYWTNSGTIQPSHVPAPMPPYFQPHPYFPPMPLPAITAPYGPYSTPESQTQPPMFSAPSQPWPPQQDPTAMNHHHTSFTAHPPAPGPLGAQSSGSRIDAPSYQWPTGDVKLECTFGQESAGWDDEGWKWRSSGSRKKGVPESATHVDKRTCLGVFHCGCIDERGIPTRFFRPKSAVDARQKQETEICHICRSSLKPVKCPATLTYYRVVDDDGRVKAVRHHVGHHDHARPPLTKLSATEVEALDVQVRQNQLLSIYEVALILPLSCQLHSLCSEYRTPQVAISFLWRPVELGPSFVSW